MPPELRKLFKALPKPKTESKKFAEDDVEEISNALDFKSMIMSELKNDKSLLKMGDGNSSDGGSESAPSEDNLAPTELLKALPVADKTLKQKIKVQEKERMDKKRGNLTIKKDEKKRPPSAKEDKSPIKRRE